MTSIISCFGVLLVLIYLTVLHFFKRNSDLSQLKWDMQTITPGDYTMQLEICKEMWNRFDGKMKSIDTYRLSDESKASKFKHYIKTELQRILNRQLTDIKEKDRIGKEQAESEGKKYVSETSGI